MEKVFYNNMQKEETHPSQKNSGDKNGFLTSKN